MGAVVAVAEGVAEEVAVGDGVAELEGVSASAFPAHPASATTPTTDAAANPTRIGRATAVERIMAVLLLSCRPPVPTVGIRHLASGGCRGFCRMVRGGGVLPR